MDRDRSAALERGTRRALGRALAVLTVLAVARTARADPRPPERGLRACPRANMTHGGAGSRGPNPCPPGTACAVGLCRPLPYPPCEARACMRPLYHAKAGGWICASACMSDRPRCVAGRCLPDLPACLVRAGEERCGAECCQALLGETCCRQPAGAICCPTGRCGPDGCAIGP